MRGAGDKIQWSADDMSVEFRSKHKTGNGDWGLVFRRRLGRNLWPSVLDILSLCVSDSQIEVSCPGLSADLILQSVVFRAQASDSGRPGFSDLLVLRPQFVLCFPVFPSIKQGDTRTYSILLLRVLNEIMVVRHFAQLLACKWSVSNNCLLQCYLQLSSGCFDLATFLICQTHDILLCIQSPPGSDCNISLQSSCPSKLLQQASLTASQSTPDLLP